MSDGTNGKLREFFKQSFARCWNQNMSAPIALLQDQENFLLPLAGKPDRNGVLIQEVGALTNGFFGVIRNHRFAFNKIAKPENLFLNLKMKEFLTAVLRNEEELGFDPKRGSYLITSVEEDPKKFVNRRKSASEFQTDFHRDFLSNPKARVYIVSDDICPTLIKDANENVETCLPYTVHCMSGHTLHSRGPMLDPKKDYTGRKRHFARCIVT